LTNSAPGSFAIPRRRVLVSLLLCLLFFGVHTGAHIEVGGVLIPFVITLLAAVIAIVGYSLHLKYRPTGPIAFFLLLSLVLNILTLREEYFSGSALGLAQLAISILAAASTYALIKKLPRQRFSALCLAGICLLAALSVLERSSAEVATAFGTLKQILVGADPYLAPLSLESERDLHLHGFTRATALAAEPSHVGLSIATLTFCWLWSAQPRFAGWCIWAIAMLVLILTVRSPILAVILVAAPSLFLVYSLKRHRRTILTAVFVAGPLIVFPAFAFLSSQFGSRLESISQGEGSFMMRVVVPANFTYNYLLQNPLLGEGHVGNYDRLANDIQTAYFQRGMYYIDDSVASSSITNAIAIHFINFGLPLGVIAAGLLVRFCWLATPSHKIVILSQMMVLWMYQGGYVSARLWVLSAAVLAAASLYEASRRDPKRI
jgi:hypothetical protein